MIVARSGSPNVDYPTNLFISFYYSAIDYYYAEWAGFIAGGLFSSSLFILASIAFYFALYLSANPVFFRGTIMGIYGVFIGIYPIICYGIF